MLPLLSTALTFLQLKWFGLTLFISLFQVNAVEMAVGKNKGLSKGGKKGVKKKV